MPLIVLAAFTSYLGEPALMMRRVSFKATFTEGVQTDAEHTSDP